MASNDDVLVRVDGVSKRFCRNLKRSLWYGVEDTLADCVGLKGGSPRLRRDEFWAVDDVSFELKRGQCLGLIGHNGAGKTTLLKMLNGLIKPDKGRIEMRGRVGALIALGAGFNPILTGRENIYVNGSVLGLTKREIDQRLEEIVDFAEIGEFIDAPVQSYSSGMAVRLGFAVATAMEPDILLLDEVLAVGDAGFQAKCYQRIGALLRNTAVILVSHQPYHIKKVCDAALLLKQGKVHTLGAPDVALRVYSEGSTVSHEKRRFLHHNVEVATLDSDTPSTGYGGMLALRCDIRLAHGMKCDQAYFNIVNEAGDLCAQSFLVEDSVVLPQGNSALALSIGPLHLPEGTYHGHLLMLTSNGKETLVQLRYAISFHHSGLIGVGSTYYPPASLTIRQIASELERASCN